MLGRLKKCLKKYGSRGNMNYNVIREDRKEINANIFVLGYGKTFSNMMIFV
jgi:hypothetical protein